MSGISQFLLTDQVGTLRAVADSTGTIVKRVDYDSFGNIIADSNPSFSVPFGFAGGLHDRDTGLVRFGYRDYSPELGRFVAKDPIDYAGGDTNLYAYVFNDPVNRSDPFGLKVINLGTLPWVVKPSSDKDAPVLVSPGGKYDYDQDGIYPYTATPDRQVLKTTDGINVLITEDNKIRFFGGDDYEKYGMAIRGGWKDEDFLKTNTNWPSRIEVDRLFREWEGKRSCP